MLKACLVLLGVLAVQTSSCRHNKLETGTYLPSDYLDCAMVQYPARYVKSSFRASAQPHCTQYKSSCIAAPMDCVEPVYVQAKRSCRKPICCPTVTVPIESWMCS